MLVALPSVCGDNGLDSRHLIKLLKKWYIIKLGMRNLFNYQQCPTKLSTYV